MITCNIVLSLSFVRQYNPEMPLWLVSDGVVRSQHPIILASDRPTSLESESDK